MKLLKLKNSTTVHHYPNDRKEVVVKFPNRKIIVANDGDGGFFIHTRVISCEAPPYAIEETFKGKLHCVTTRYTQEGAEALMIALAETLGYAICEKIKPKE